MDDNFREEYQEPARKTATEDVERIARKNVQSVRQGEPILGDVSLLMDTVHQVSTRDPEIRMADTVREFLSPETDTPPKRFRMNILRWAADAAYDPHRTAPGDILEVSPAQSRYWQAAESLYNSPIPDAVLQRAGIPSSEDIYRNVIREEVDSASVGPEELHNFTLIHDDIHDEALTEGKNGLRRGNPTVDSQEEAFARALGLSEKEAARMGIAQAINIGDYLFALSDHPITDTRFTTEKKDEFKDIFREAAIYIIQGQYRDLYMESVNPQQVITEGQGAGQVSQFLMGPDDTAEDLYLDMIGKKTGFHYMADADAGVMLVDGTEEQRRELQRFAYHAAIAFQIRDDGNEVRIAAEDDPEDIGKTESDMYTGKLTLHYIRAVRNVRESGTDRELEMLQNVYGNPDSPPSEMQETAEIIQKYTDAPSIAKDHVEEAKRYLNEAGLPGRTQPLEALAEYMANRSF